MSPQRYVGNLAEPCTGCPSGPFEPCDSTYAHCQLTGPGALAHSQRLGYRLAEGLEAIIDELVKLPPFSWLDWLLRGPVTPPK